MWHECEGGRGSCEMASCLRKYLKALPDTVTEVTFFSDRCGGQNLNKFVAAMFLSIILEIPHLQTVNLKFLVVGHSEMECDSMHSSIAREQKRVGKALWPEDWKTIARSARRKGDKAYLVHDLNQQDIYDFKKFIDNNMVVRKLDEDNKPVRWQKICWMSFTKSKPFIMGFKENYDEKDFRFLNFNKKSKRFVNPASTLQLLYKGPIPISNAKYNNLTSLFTLKPPALVDYYNLPHEKRARDVVDEEGNSD
ncbi:hypothetical protein NQ314_020621 [Rhamnusium bicolor]|uniref:DUF7869 domain-containing protein n=1 Tax=Rhamnusium bicolor TaxID=1586634 RepID=A0AAV8WJP4_9CUCU|nr:hypothetical protein NQ314_020621 [Rhamnusium bicolor]